MITTLNSKELTEYIKNQLDTFFPDKYHFCGNDVDSAVRLALDRTEYCFNNIIRKPYFQNNNAHFSHLHSDQYGQFLYFLSNSLWTISENKVLCDKLVFLNKLLNNYFFTYKCPLPDIFFFNHPVGTILGNASYSNYLIVCQNVTVNTGTEQNGKHFPEIGEKVFLSAGCKIIGDYSIGDHVIIGVDAVVYKREIPSNSFVIRDNDGKITIKPYNKQKNSIINTFFKIK